MQKKIIAACCLIVAVTLIFASCGNKYQMIESNGILHPVVTDADGNTEVNEEGKLAVYVTDAHGDVVTNADGSVQKNYVEMPDIIVNDKDNVVETSLYKFTMPQGWEPGENGVFYKKNTDENCYVQIVLKKQLSTDHFETFDSVMNQVIFENQQAVEEVKKTYPDAAMNIEEGTLSNGAETVNLSYIIKDETGVVAHYAYDIYFCIEDAVYKVNYICIDGVGYDETFDIKSVVEQNLIIK